jgi:hypothetical protein
MTHEHDTGEGEKVFNIVSDLLDKVDRIDLTIGKNYDIAKDDYFYLSDKYEYLLKALCEQKKKTESLEKKFLAYKMEQESGMKDAMKNMETILKNIAQIMKEKGVEPLQEFGCLAVDKIATCENRPAWWISYGKSDSEFL